VSAPVSDDTASEIGLEIVEQLTTLGEPTLRSLGLASWYPNGWVQAGLEAVHVGLNLPWWSTIVVSKCYISVCTVCVTVHLYYFRILVRDGQSDNVFNCHKLLAMPL